MASFRPIALAFDDRSTGAMAEAVDDRSATQPIGEGLYPFGELQVASDYRGTPFVALGDELVEVFVLWAMKWP